MPPVIVTTLSPRRDDVDTPVLPPVNVIEPPLIVARALTYGGTANEMPARPRPGSCRPS